MMSGSNPMMTNFGLLTGFILLFQTIIILVYMRSRKLYRKCIKRMEYNRDNYYYNDKDNKDDNSDDNKDDKDEDFNV